MSTTQTVLDLEPGMREHDEALAIDAIQKGIPVTPARRWVMSPTVYCLWQKASEFDPEDPI